MRTNKKIILEIEDLEKNFDQFQLKIPNLSIYEGECVGLIGENGAGKTTLIKLILSLINKDKGGIKVFESNTINTPIKEEIGVVFDQCSYSGLLCIRELNKILKRIYINKWNENQFISDVKKQGLLLEKEISTFSQGMKAKLDIISAFAHSPKLLILDEATSNLDPVIRREINEEIRNYTDKTGCTILFSSHLVNELELICDRIFLIDGGSIILETSPDELKSNYYIANIDINSDIPNETISIIKKENYLSCLMYGVPNDIDGKSITKGVSVDDLMYYLKRGVKVI